MVVLLKYLDDTLGVKTETKLWDKAEKLPYYLKDSYDIQEVFIDGLCCLFIKPKGDLGTLTTIKKHLTKLQETEPAPIVLELDNITARRRKSLIEAHIPFVVPESQIYLPFMGVALTERYLVDGPVKTKLMPSSQLLLFCFLYQNAAALYMNGMAERLGMSAMQVSRAVRQLKHLGLVDVTKQGVQIVISCKAGPRELFESARSYLLDPVYKRVYAERGSFLTGLPISGFTALSELTMLNPPAMATFAFYGKDGKLAGSDTPVDSEKQVEVEIWRYAPVLLTQNPGTADTLSLIASVSAQADERTEQAIGELLESLWG
jgi:DNA-binding MarR family transcriptional regulator